MATMKTSARVGTRPSTSVGTIVVVALTVATAAIHFSLGGLLFLANAIGYASLAAAMILPGPFAQMRWLVRLGLVGFTAVTIGGWLLFGARFPLAYVDKVIEVGLIGATAIELRRVDGGPLGVVRKARGLAGRLTAGKRLRASR
jgi:hypothetical protein